MVNLDKYKDEFKKFITKFFSDKDIKIYLYSNNFDSIYKDLERWNYSLITGIPNQYLITMFTEFLMRQDIDPLDYLTYVPKNYLSYSSYVKQILIPDNIQQVFCKAFCDCYNLQRVIIGNNVQTIAEEAFEYCKNLETVVIGDNTTIIEYEAFHKCTSLQTVNLGKRVTGVGDSAFDGCISLTNIDLSNVTNIGGTAFWGCSSLSDINLHGVSHIGKFAFAECWSLSSIDLSNVTSIGEGAFNFCRSLKSITIDKNAKILKKYLFYKCDSLETIIFNGSKEEWPKYAPAWIIRQNLKVICKG